MINIQQEQEEWRPVVGYEGMYEVSDQGRVRSLDRYVNSGNRFNDKVTKKLIKGQLLKQIEKREYLTVNLKREQKGSTQTVHKLVAEAFIGARPKGYHIDHKNENKLCNLLSNLRYLTPQQNTARSWSGVKRHNAKLSYELVKDIKWLVQNGVSMSAIGRKLGVSHAAISKAVNGLTWNKYKGD